jgi:hypothetical protein
LRRTKFIKCILASSKQHFPNSDLLTIHDHLPISFDLIQPMQIIQHRLTT